MASRRSGKKPGVNTKEPVPTVAPELRAQVALRPSANAAGVIQAFGASPFGELDFGALTSELIKSIDQVNDNDMSRCEAMLFSQANALQSIFVNLSRRAVNQEYLRQYECYMRIALKAQNQCRMTLETLATVKNPPVFAKQANIAHGPQQVNNGTPPSASTPARAEKSQFAQNKLLEATHGEWLDTPTAGAASGTDPAMATVAPLDRTAHG